MRLGARLQSFRSTQFDSGYHLTHSCFIVYEGECHNLTATYTFREKQITVSQMIPSQLNGSVVLLFP